MQTFGWSRVGHLWLDYEIPDDVRCFRLYHTGRHAVAGYLTNPMLMEQRAIR